MFQTEPSWVVCYWEGEEQHFTRLDTKEEVMDFIQDHVDQRIVNINDFIIFPPASSITKDKIVKHGVPKLFLKED